MTSQPSDVQGFDNKRFQVIPRVLIFVFRDEKEVLLIKGSPTKKIWANKYNGIGGHVEPRETIKQAALRELKEESGIFDLPLAFCGNLIIDLEAGRGIQLFVFKGAYSGQQLTDSSEGKLEWIKVPGLEGINVVEDLPVLIPKVLSYKLGMDPFWGISYFDDNGRLNISFD